MVDFRCLKSLCINSLLKKKKRKTRKKAVRVFFFFSFFTFVGKMWGLEGSQMGGMSIATLYF